MITHNLDSGVLIDLITQADEGNRDMINKLHNYYCLEKYITQDLNTDFVQILTERAINDKPYSLLQLAMMYLLGLGLDQDFDKGIELLKKSINVDCSQAYLVMAMLVLTKQTEYELDYNELLSRAMAMENSSAYVQKGIEYSDIDFKKSSEYYELAIKLNNDYAIYKLGELHHDNNKYESAIKYYEQAINKGVHHAYFNMAVMYREGEGVDIDIDEAKKLFKKAIELGSVKAMTCIGGLYEQLDNIKKAKKYYKLAIAENDTFAKYNLGLIYKSEEQHLKAIRCFIESAKDGHGASQHKLIYDYNVTNLDMDDEEIDKLLKWHHSFKNFGAYDGFLSR